MKIDFVLFDLGKVLLDWDPRYFYRQFFPGDEAALERFLAEAAPTDWTLSMDRGEPVAEAIARRQREAPEHAALIGRWFEGWPRMLRGEIADSVDILDAVDRAGYPIYALTNFSTETWPIATARCAVLGRFRDVVISGEVGMVKPEHEIYRHTIERCGLDPARTLFIDDLSVNVQAARECGLNAVQFTSAQRLRADLAAHGVRLA